jgi:hypothetical protein
MRRYAGLLNPAARRTHDPLRCLAGAENLCHQAILMNHASGAVTPLDPETVQVGDAIGQRERRGLLQGAVRPVHVVQILVLPQHDHQVPLVPDQRPVPGKRSSQGSGRAGWTAAPLAQAVSGPHQRGCNPECDIPRERIARSCEALSLDIPGGL